MAAAASKGASKGVKDPRLKPYHLLPPDKGPQVGVCVHGAATRRRCRAPFRLRASVLGGSGRYVWPACRPPLC